MEEWLLINPREIKIQPLWKRWLCVHKFTGGARVVYDREGRKKHARICLKCGQRQYID
ncbi:MAG: hypothetical protein K2N61_08600 [Lachnospiraceae bacterium]|nr:hypothetical protein [Lachnospiraceae bacterium]MDE7308697.1 hypothetical protein [Lachnospiraceae bacterium]